ncbi:MAG TPA: tetratricopeptide repeat protein [Burkholderiales bacterium]|jgi:MSHA biogenesis protein MshN
MSVINHVLLNLEKRRASPEERGLLPAHVQVPPESARPSYRGWIVAGVAFAFAAPAAWMALTATVGQWTPAPARKAADGVTEKVIAPSVGANDAASRAPETFRPSLELANPPADATPPPRAEAAQAGAGAREPLSTSRLIGRTDAKPATEAAPATAPAKRRSEARAQVAGARQVPAAVPPMTPEIRKQVREPTPRELAENQYRKAVAWLNQGRTAEAEAGLQEALGLHPEHLQARQALVGLLVQDRKLEEAERLLEEGVKLTPGQIGFNTTLARLQADRGDNERAIATLQAGLEHAQGSAEYAAFLAALLQRQGRHEEAIAQFQTALRIRPSWGVWWLGLAMSLQATGRPTAASDAYRQARAAGNLHPELAALAEQRLQQLR